MKQLTPPMIINHLNGNFPEHLIEPYTRLRMAGVTTRAARRKVGLCNHKGCNQMRVNDTAFCQQHRDRNNALRQDREIGGRVVMERHNVELCEYVYGEYHLKNRSLADIGKEVGYDKTTISRWLNHAHHSGRMAA